MLRQTEDISTLGRLLAARDPSVLEYLYQYARLLEVVLERRYGHALDAEDRKDIVADALIHAWQTGDRFDPTLSAVKSWLVMITVYRAREFLRRHGEGNSLPLDDVDPGMLVAEYPPSVDEEQPSAIVRRLLQQLPARRARVMEMYYYEGRPVTEIAATFGITPTAVRSHLSHGRAGLRQALGDASAEA